MKIIRTKPSIQRNAWTHAVAGPERQIYIKSTATLCGGHMGDWTTDATEGEIDDITCPQCRQFLAESAPAP